MDKFEIKNAGRKGKGAYATEKILKGEAITEFTGEKLSRDQINYRIAEGKENIDDPLQIDDEIFLDLDSSAYYFNHSCEPNSAIRGKTELIAIEDIQRGEEITYDYSATVGINITDWTMECKCGSPICRHIIGNVSTVPKEQLQKYLAAGGVQDYVRNQLKISEPYN